MDERLFHMNMQTTFLQLASEIGNTKTDVFLKNFLKVTLTIAIEHNRFFFVLFGETLEVFLLSLQAVETRISFQLTKPSKL